MHHFTRRCHALFNPIFRRKQIKAEMVRSHFENGSLDLVVKHPDMAQIASIFGEYFISQGCVNYLTLTMFDKATIGTFELTMQRVGHPTPAQANTKMRDALEQIAENPIAAQTLAQTTLLSLGYL